MIDCGATMNLGMNLRRTAMLVAAPFFATALWASEIPKDPAQLMREVVENELNAGATDHTSWRYVEQRDYDQKVEMRDVVSTPDLWAYVVLTVNGEATSADEECRRFTKLLSDPAELKHNWRAQQNDVDKIRALMRTMPDALLFRYDPGESTVDRVGMSFTPNPDFHPTTLTADIFRHLEGEVIVDTRAKRLVEINASLTSSVRFGGGLLGHLDRGGSFVIKQEDVGSGHWEPVFVDLDMRGRVLLVSFSLHQRIRHSDYRQLPDNLTPKQIISLMVGNSTSENAELR
jgi:hypothetical protein